MTIATFIAATSKAPIESPLPDVQMVADLLFKRTQEVGSTRKVTTFTDKTSPTADQVERIIEDQAQWYVAAHVGILKGDTVHVPDIVVPMVKPMIALYAAILVDESYEFTVGTENISTLDRRQARFDRYLPFVEGAVQDAFDGEDPGSVDDRLMPLYSFPTRPVRAPGTEAPYGLTYARGDSTDVDPYGPY